MTAGQIRSTLVLGAYAGVGRLMSGTVRRRLRGRVARGKEDPDRLNERFGRPALARPAGDLVWVHGASVGESLSALPLIDRLLERYAAITVLVTTGTTAAAQVMAQRLPERALHQFAPVDLPDAVAGFFDHWRPQAGVLIESEFWPNLLLAAHRRQVPMALLSARLSARSGARWRFLKNTFSAILAPFHLVLTQSQVDTARLRGLGVARAETIGSLKLASPPLPVDEAELAAMRPWFDAAPTWMFASTRGEEAEIAWRAQRRVAQSIANARLLLAPRHPDRGEAIAQAACAQGFRVARRSVEGRPGPDCQVFVADSLGEMGLWYSLADVAIMGASFARMGGQNPLEPALLGCPVILGPDMSNFALIEREMLDAGAAEKARDADRAGEILAAMLADPDRRAAVALAARRYAEVKAGVIDEIMARVFEMLDPVCGPVCG